MAQKLWEKNVQVDRDIEKFTVGKDREMAQKHRLADS